jgi:enamine deaminase RidA (YjgF/YER057c/UK114 family)
VERRNISSGSPYEPLIGFSRAVVVGHHVSVSGTAPIMPDGREPPSDAYGQARRVLEIILAALAEAGATAEQVVRTRTFLTRAQDWEQVGRTVRSSDRFDRRTRSSSSPGSSTPDG